MGCGIYVRWPSPSTVAGLHSASLVIYDSLGSQTVGLRCTVSTAAVSLSTYTLDVGSVAVGSTSASKALTLTSTGTGPLNVLPKLL